jgi:hypothetical protein
MDSVRKALAAVVTVLCVVTLVSACFLTFSYVTLKGIGDLRPLTVLIVFIVEAGATLLALSLTRFGFGLDVIVLAGAGGLTWLGWSMVLNALASPHFEGYAVLMGGIGILQGAFTLMLFVWRVVTGAAPRAIG